MRTTIALLLLAVLGAGNIAAQESVNTDSINVDSVNVDSETLDRIKQQSLNWQYGLVYSQSVSQNELRKAYDSLALPMVGYGLAAQFAYYMDPVPAVFGGEIGVHFFGTRDREFGPTPGDPLRTRLELTTQNYTLPILAFARFQPNISTWVFPYVEALGGITIFSSVLNVRQIRGNSDTTARNTESEGGSSWTYGVGTGVAIKFADMIELPNTLQRFLVDIRFRYLWGSSASIPHIEPTADQRYEVRRVSVESPTQVVFQLGITFQM